MSCAMTTSEMPPSSMDVLGSDPRVTPMPTSMLEEDKLEENSTVEKTVFLLEPEIMVEYLEGQKTSFDTYIMLALFSLGLMFYVGRCDVLHPFDDGFYQSCSFTGLTFSLSLYILLLSSRYVPHYYSKEACSFYTITEPWADTLISDLIAISGTLGAGFGLYGRVRNGQCAVDISLWDSQWCNPVASASALPIDHVMFLFVMPLILQSVVNCMTYRGTVICWAISNCAILSSIVYVSARFHIWMCVSSLVILVLTYKYEKLARVKFAHKRNTSAAEREKRKHMLLQECAEHNLLSEKIKHELEILSIKSQEECRLMEKEQEQMVAMIGNIAHDLKTPLQSFLMDLESLKANQEFRHSPDTGPDGPASILQSLESTCCFMSMAINRSIDFAKASRNIALVPHMETFNMPEALEMAVSVIRHLKSSSEVFVHPFPSNMCVNMITDKHWFKENILCLLSNAVKYSNGGIVNVTVLQVYARMQQSESESKLDNESPASPAISALGYRNSCPNYESMIVFSIEDGGIGISEKERAELFQPFKQAQRLAGGTGLGLYSLSNRIRALKGTRGVKSRDDGQQGSVFWFSIPYRPDLQFSAESSKIHTPMRSRRGSIEGTFTISHSCTFDIDAVVKATGDVTASPTPKQPLRFLVVDDSSSILKVLCRTLRNKKYEVETAANGMLGLNRLIAGYATHDFDVVLMDLQMPMMDGIEAVKRFRDFEATQKGQEIQLIRETISAAADSLEFLQKSSSLDHDTNTPLLESPFSTYSTPTNSSNSTHSPCTTPPLLTPLLLTPQVNDTPNRDVFIIGMSANSDEDTKQCALNSGMNTFLAKPFSMAELLPLLNSIIQNKN